MNPSPYERCCCIGWANPCEVCEDKLTFSEKGKYDIRVAEIIHGEATSKIPDLRERLFSN